MLDLAPRQYTSQHVVKRMRQQTLGNEKTTLAAARRKYGSDLYKQRCNAASLYPF